MGNVTTVGPNEALIVSGGWRTRTRKKIVVGGWTWRKWLVTDVQRISLNIMTLNPVCEDVETHFGVQLTVTGVAQCKVIKTKELLLTAAEQFLGKSVRQIKSSILQTLEGHLRAILATLTVEEVFKERVQFAALVREVAAPDVGRMGIEIVSFTIRDIFDNVNYLSSLGKARTAEVKRDAAIGIAESNRDAGIRESECLRKAMDVKYAADTKIADHERKYKLQKASFDMEVNAAYAQAEMAYELQTAITRQEIRHEEIEIEVVERRKEIQVAELEMTIAELERKANAKLPTEAECYKLKMIAEGRKTEVVEAGKAEGEKIKNIGFAEAYSISNVGLAEAAGKKLSAVAYKGYGQAAIMSMTLDSLPKIAACVSAPLAKTDEIVLLGGNDHFTGEATRLVSQFSPAVEAVTGINLSNKLREIARK